MDVDMTLGADDVRDDRRLALVVLGGMAALMLAAPLLPADRGLVPRGTFLSLHATMEVFSIVVSMMVFAIGWFSRDRSRPGNVVVMALCFLGVGAVDVAHTLSFPGMPGFFAPSSTERGIIFWLLARVLAAAGLAFLVLRRLPPMDVGGRSPYGLVAGLVVVGLLLWLATEGFHLFPRTYIDGSGLTLFKVAFEYGLILAYLGLGGLLWRRALIQPRHWLACGAVVMGMAEMFFTVYAEPTDIYNLLGHVYKVAAYAMLYKALFVTSIREPFRRLAQSRQELADSESRVRSIIDASKDALVGIDGDGRVVAFNPAAESMLRVSASDALGRLAVQVLPRTVDGVALASLSEAARGLAPHSHQEAVLRLEGKAALELEVQAFDAGGGGLPMRVLSLRDVTERRRAEAEEQSRAAEIASLHHISQRLSATLSLDEMANWALEDILAVIKCDAALLLLFDEGVPRLLKSQGGVNQADSRFPHVLRLAKLAAAQSSPQYGRLPSVGWLAVLPMVRGSDCFGALALVDMGAPSGFQDRSRFLEAITGEIASFTHSALLYENLRAHGEALALANSGLNAEIATRIQTERALEQSRRDLELRVEERTVDLQQEVVERRFAEESLRKVLIELESQGIELLRAKDAADSANRAKSEFLSSVSHELRTPLNAVLGFAQMLASQVNGPLSEKQQQHVGYILQAGQLLLSLINQVLDLARIEAGTINLSVEPVDVAPVMEECLTQTRTLATSFAVQVNDWTLAQQPLPPVLADPARLRQILLNLMSNAVKYNHQGGQVDLSAEVTGKGMLRFSVRDTGLGIPPEKQGQLFQPFCRLGAEVSDVDGAGVGLTITKQLVERMNGRIAFETQAGQGSCFWIELPVAGVARDDLPSSSDQFSRQAATLGRGKGSARRILYVEDNPASLRLMKDLLETIPGISLMSAPTAELGLEIAGITHPDLIILDINLPGISGLEALRRLKSDPSLAATPVVLLSANVTTATIRDGMAAGAARFLGKPLDVQEFLGVVRRLCGLNGAPDVLPG